MPIRPENAARYPKNWREISRRIRFERAQGKCEFPCCEARHGKLHPITKSKVVLTVAHLDHVPEHCDGMENGGDILPIEKSNLRAWCQQHHNAYDAPMRAQGIRKRRREKLAIGELI